MLWFGLKKRIESLELVVDRPLYEEAIKEFNKYSIYAFDPKAQIKVEHGKLWLLLPVVEEHYEIYRQCRLNDPDHKSTLKDIKAKWAMYNNKD